MKQLYGVLLIVVSAAAFGAMAVLAPIAYNAGTNPITLLFLRFTIAGLAMAMLMVVRKKEFPRGKLLLSLVLMGGVWYVAQSLAYFTALTMASASLVALLLYLYPALVALISAIVFRERMTRPKLASLGIALAGTVLTIGPSREGESFGILLALTAAVLYATYIVVGGELMERVEALPATTVIMLAAGISYGGIVAVQGFQAPSETGGWMAIVATAGCSIVAIGAFFAGLEKVGAANAAVLSTVEPFVTVGLAALVLRERIEPVQLVGGFCILIAVVFLTRSEFVEVDTGSTYLAHHPPAVRDLTQLTFLPGRSMLAKTAVIAVVLFAAPACNATSAPDTVPLVRPFPTSTPAVSPIASTSTPRTMPRKIPLRRSDSNATGGKGEQALYRLVEEEEMRGDVIADHLGENEMMCVQHFDLRPTQCICWIGPLENAGVRGGGLHGMRRIVILSGSAEEAALALIEDWGADMRAIGGREPCSTAHLTVSYDGGLFKPEPQ